ncbi:hypothetical protein BDY21DRAFT_54350 [Lineolata rhizophorae]|uniref:Uncharacterized protein n=1 Tax=Lineolata rhizophorae TaxID=578093 RepID=A0A6A6NYE8_9PEZI|nr:hypothetical protein BDY21DRAFT_54350 [Lineolata rhizophorae]
MEPQHRGLTTWAPAGGRARLIKRPHATAMSMSSPARRLKMLRPVYNEYLGTHTPPAPSQAHPPPAHGSELYTFLSPFLCFLSFLWQSRLDASAPPRPKHELRPVALCDRLPRPAAIARRLALSSRRAARGWSPLTRYVLHGPASLFCPPPVSGRPPAAVTHYLLLLLLPPAPHRCCYCRRCRRRGCVGGPSRGALIEIFRLKHTPPPTKNRCGN